MKKNIYVRPAALSVELQSDESVLLGSSLSKYDDPNRETGGSEALSRKQNGWFSSNWAGTDGYWTNTDEQDY